MSSHNPSRPDKKIEKFKPSASAAASFWGISKLGLKAGLWKLLNIKTDDLTKEDLIVIEKNILEGASRLHIFAMILFNI
jgi:hypothetical protein